MPRQFFTERADARRRFPCILSLMRKWPKINLSSKTRLIAIAVVALLLPTVVLSVVQFRSLVDLEDKTKVAVQENMRQTLHTVSRKVEENLKGLARKNLSDIRMSDLEPENFQRLESHFAAVKRDAGQLAIQTIGQLAAQSLSSRAAQPSRSILQAAA